MSARQSILGWLGPLALIGIASCGGPVDGPLDGPVGEPVEDPAGISATLPAGESQVTQIDEAASVDAPGPSAVEPELASALRRRVASQCALRLEEDFASLYQLVAPADRERIDLRGFLQVYGGGVLVVEELLPLEIEVDPSGEFADVLMRTVGRLELERLPERYRQSLRTPDPEALVRELEHRVRWEQIDGEWYFRLDEAVDHRT